MSGNTKSDDLTPKSHTGQQSPRVLYGGGLLLPNISSETTTLLSTQETVTPTLSSPDSDNSRSRRGSIANALLGKVSGLLSSMHGSDSRSRTHSLSREDRPRDELLQAHSIPPNQDTGRGSSRSRSSSHQPSPQPLLSSRALKVMVKETHTVYLEYDPRTKRKVLNTYEILREIGKGEHGKVKLARDLENNELVAIKIVNRKSRKERPRFKRREPSIGTEDRKGGDEISPLHRKLNNEYELKIKREIAIMKKCNHKHIVKLKEVLDDEKSHKIYLVLEYLEKGEIKWKRKLSEINRGNGEDQGEVQEETETGIETQKGKEKQKEKGRENDDDIPCCGNTVSPAARKTSLTFDENSEEDENNLLLDQYTPNLTFKQSRKILRDVILGLEYLHMQGIVHRDIKPANLLVSSANVVKISDFGVSFASSLDSNEDGVRVSEMELAKTAGTPAFFAPELCQSSFSPNSSMTSVNDGVNRIKTKPPKVDHKIDIWALGVTLYCILFGKVPFNADTEFKLFDVIVNEPLTFPDSPESFNSPDIVTVEEFELAKDLLLKLLDKDSKTRIDIEEIKQHPFVLMDLEKDPEFTHEFLYSNTREHLEALCVDFDSILHDEIDSAIIGIGSRIRKSVVQALRSGNNHDYRKKMSHGMEKTESQSSDDESGSGTGSGSGSAGTGASTGTGTPSNYTSTMMKLNSSEARSIIVSESLNVSSPPQTSSSRNNSSGNLYAQFFEGHATHVPSGLSNQVYDNTNINDNNNSTHNPLRSNLLLQDVLDAQSPSTSRRGSVTPITEAPMVETKRNVGGDLYLKTQTALEAFKGIQQQDERRRKSSVFTSPTTSNPNTAKNSISFDEDSSSSQQKTQFPKPIPINIDIKKERRSNSIISLPLNESFASLDSFSDDYLSQKYFPDNYNKNATGYRTRRRSSSTSQLNDTAYVDGNIIPPLSQINEKLKNFDLGSQMKPKIITFDLSGGPDQPEDIEPTAKPILNRKTSTSSYSSYSSSSSSSGSDSEEEGNLTLAFTSKVPSARPHFLSLSNRAKSHDSHLPRLAQHSANIYENFPTVFSENMAAFEDVPAGLMGDVPRQSVSNESSSMKQTVSIVSSNTSSATITPNYANQSPLSPDSTINFEGSQQKAAAIPFAPNYSKQSNPQPFQQSKLLIETNISTIIPDRSITPNSKFNMMQKEFYSKDRLASPLANNAPAADNATINSHLVAKYVNGDNKNPSFINSQFNNHYKKDPIAFPFPNAIHLENDKESFSKTVSKGEPRPQHYRSSSITVGFLQMNKDKVKK